MVSHSRLVFLWFHGASPPQASSVGEGSFFGSFSFLIVEPEVGARTTEGLGTGVIAGIVIAVILIVLITIDLFCCFFNSCGVIFCCHQAMCGGGGGGVTGGKDDCKY